QFELGGDEWSVVPGARLTWNEQWGTAFTPRVAARWRATPELTLRLAVGQGFRAPDFKELYLQFVNDAAGYAVYGNRDLRPEHSDNVTAGAEWTEGAFYARGQLFWNRLRDFIETRPLPDANGQVAYGYANVEQGLTRGADIEVGVALGGVRAEAAYGWLNAVDRLTDLPLLGRPSHSARATVSGALPHVGRGSLSGVYTGSTPMERDAAGAVIGERDSFLRLDARLARALPLGAELSVGVDNIFDSRPARWEGAIGRQLYTALSWTVGR
ncbi:MAG: TonB-dependent receptor plug domain-containing protein, partial [Gemmatimonadaceae bacterium]